MHPCICYRHGKRQADTSSSTEDPGCRTSCVGLPGLLGRTRCTAEETRVFRVGRRCPPWMRRHGTLSRYVSCCLQRSPFEDLIRNPLPCDSCMSAPLRRKASVTSAAQYCFLYSAPATSRQTFSHFTNGHCEDSHDELTTIILEIAASLRIASQARQLQIPRPLSASSSADHGTAHLAQELAAASMQSPFELLNNWLSSEVSGSVV
jgi:hypothetical protein